MIPRYQVTWHVSLRFPLPAQRDTWHRDPNGAAYLLACLRATALWPRFEQYAQGLIPGVPIGPLPAIEAQLASVPDIYTFARGDAQAAMFLEESELAARLSVRSDSVDLQIVAAGAELDRLGAAFLDDVLALLAAFYARWRGKVQLALAVAVPSGLTYPRPRPPRAARRYVAAIVDVLAPEAPEGPGTEGFFDETRALAAAALPSQVRRHEDGGLIVLRWVEDPGDQAQVGAAAGRHERWLTGLVETDVASGWNEHGDRRVSGWRPTVTPPFRAVDAAKRIGYLELDPGDPAALDAAAALATALPEGIAEVWPLASDRAAALRLQPLAATHGLPKVVYSTPDGIWDPFPDGIWLADEA